MQYYIGIDGGGSNSRLVAITKEGKEVGRSVGGSTNITSQTYDGVFANIKKLVDEFLYTSGVGIKDCAGVCIGSAGASTGDNAELLKKIFCTIGFTCNIIVINDAELVLRSATQGQPGIIIISGTGSVGYALDGSGNMLRVGGWGHIIDDGGSGYRIGMDAIKAALLDFDGRGEKTLLTNMVTEFFDIESTEQVLKYIYGGDFDKAKVAKIALLVSQAAQQGDNVAQQILQSAAQNLIAVAIVLIERAQLNAHKIVLSGSVILQNTNIRTIFEQHIYEMYPNMQIVQMSTSAEMGAAYLAIK